MSQNCSNCGKTSISTGVLKCPVCDTLLTGKGTLASPSITSLKPPSAGSPMLLHSSGRRYLLLGSSSTFIGSKGCGILLSDPGVPQKAAQITPYKSGFIIENISGTIRVNGMSITNLVPLNPGDKIQIGSADLVYQGPGTPALPASTASMATIPPTAPVVVTPTPPVILPTAPYGGMAFKKWTKPPVVEGLIDLVDGPHQIDKGGFAKKAITSVFLGMVHSSLGMLPFFGRQHINVWFLRIKDHTSSKLVNVMMQGDPTNLPRMGDFVAVWGQVKDGNIIMQSGYSYTTDSNIQVKR